MPVTMKQVLAEIDKDEPNYPAFTQLGPEALPHLQMIIEADDPLKAAKAAYAASIIGGDESIPALRTAADHHDPQVRIAAAQGMRNLADKAPSDLVLKSLNDSDSGVRKLAIDTAEVLNRADFGQRVAAMAKDDPADHLRKAASDAAKKLKPR
jgi:HEAT repeats